MAIGWGVDNEHDKFNGNVFGQNGKERMNLIL
jgi:hypothetical protein